MIPTPLVRPVLAGNWKMHMPPGQVAAFFERFSARVPQVDTGTVAFFPPALSLAACVRSLGGRTDILLGVQNIHWEAQGAFTGETSAAMAADAGAQLVLVGHSERRHLFGETDYEAGLKVRAALDSGLLVVLCVGESLEERKADRVAEVILRQLDAGLADVEGDALARVTIAYEPVWAIGTGVHATPADASAAHATLRAQLAGLGPLGEAVPILYGGSVKPDNAGALLAATHVDGLLVGGASLDPEGFAQICTAA